MSDEIPVARRQLAPGSAPTDLWSKVLHLLKTYPWVILGVGILLVMGMGLLLRGSPPVALDPIPTPEVEEVSDDPLLPSPELVGSRLSVLGHFAYTEAPIETLELVGSYHGRQIYLRNTAAVAYGQMTQAAAAAGIRLVPISGFRTTQDQEFLFFQRAQAQALRPDQRAEVSAPPGYSEHHTGYAVDISDAAYPQTDLQVSFEQTPGFVWMQAHAARYGFELSFPRDNEQGISYEPWHWRYVGDVHSLETFYQAQQ